MVRSKFHDFPPNGNHAWSRTPGFPKLYFLYSIPFISNTSTHPSKFFHSWKSNILAKSRQLINISPHGKIRHPYLLVSFSPNFSLIIHSSIVPHHTANSLDFTFSNSNKRTDIPFIHNSSNGKIRNPYPLVRFFQKYFLDIFGSIVSHHNVNSLNFKPSNSTDRSNIPYILHYKPLQPAIVPPFSINYYPLSHSSLSFRSRHYRPHNLPSTTSVYITIFHCLSTLNHSREGFPNDSNCGMLAYLPRYCPLRSNNHRHVPHVSREGPPNDSNCGMLAYLPRYCPRRSNNHRHVPHVSREGPPNDSNCGMLAYLPGHSNPPLFTPIATAQAPAFSVANSTQPNLEADTNPCMTGTRGHRYGADIVGSLPPPYLEPLRPPADTPVHSATSLRCTLHLSPNPVSYILYCRCMINVYYQDPPLQNSSLRPPPTHTMYVTYR